MLEYIFDYQDWNRDNFPSENKPKTQAATGSPSLDFGLEAFGSRVIGFVAVLPTSGLMQDLKTG